LIKIKINLVGYETLPPAATFDPRLPQKGQPLKIIFKQDKNQL